MVNRGDRVVRVSLNEGKLEVCGGTVINETSGEGPVTISYDDGAMVDMPKADAGKLAIEGSCIACGTALTENAHFCGKCGAANVFEDIDKTADYLSRRGGSGHPFERMLTAAKERLGAPAVRGSAVPVTAA